MPDDKDDDDDTLPVLLLLLLHVLVLLPTSAVAPPAGAVVVVRKNMWSSGRHNQNVAMPNKPYVLPCGAFIIYAICVYVSQNQPEGTL
jgi:hypothetical protein